MSPSRESASIPASCFPRVSGDEPSLADVDLDDPEFSPRERG